MKLGLQLLLMYENKRQALASTSTFYRRVFNNILTALAIMAVSLLIGVLGYHQFANANWVDSFHNASMILSGMGPVIDIKSNGGKIFSSFYALFSGIVFIGNVGIILAPAIHRLVHRLHLEDQSM
jgi:hypothetical protein